MTSPAHKHHCNACTFIGTMRVYGTDNDFYLHHDMERDALVIMARWNSEPAYYTNITVANLPRGGEMSDLSRAARTLYDLYIDSQMNVQGVECMACGCLTDHVSGVEQWCDICFEEWDRQALAGLKEELDNRHISSLWN